MTSDLRLSKRIEDNTANISKLDKDSGQNFSALTTGWIEANETWTYASANAITVPSGSKYQEGDKFKLVANGVVLQGYIVGVVDSLLTVAGDTLTNHTFSDNFYSRADNPLGFDHWFDLSPTWGGIDNGSGGQPDTSEFRFSLNGRAVKCHFRIYGFKDSAGRYIWFASSAIKPAITNYTQRVSIGSGVIYYDGSAELPVNIMYYSGDGSVYCVVEASMADNTQIYDLAGTFEYEF